VSLDRLIVVVREDLGVQGRSEDQREQGDVEALAGHLLSAGSVFAFLAEHRRRLFPDEVFADLFPSSQGARACRRTLSWPSSCCRPCTGCRMPRPCRRSPLTCGGRPHSACRWRRPGPTRPLARVSTPRGRRRERQRQGCLRPAQSAPRHDLPGGHRRSRAAGRVAASMQASESAG